MKKKEPRITVGLTLSPYLVEEARKRNLNISRIAEQALLSILDYYPQETENETSKTPDNGSRFPNERSFKESSVVPRAGFEPATTRSSAERSPRLSYLGKVGNSRREANVLLRFLNSSV